MASGSTRSSAHLGLPRHERRRLGAECSRLSERFRGVAISGGHGLDTNAKGSVIRSISPELQLDKGALCRVLGRPVSDCGRGASTHGAMAFRQRLKMVYLRLRPWTCCHEKKSHVGSLSPLYDSLVFHASTKGQDSESGSLSFNPKCR